MLPPEFIHELPHDFALALRTTIHNHHKAYQILDIFHHPGICLTLHKTAHNLRRYLHNSGINTQKLHMIDPLARVIGSVLEAENTTYIAYNMQQMIDTTERLLQKLPLKQRFMMIDGIHVLPYVYKEEKINSFFKTLNNKLKLHHAKGIFIYDREKLHLPIRNHLHKLVDKVIEME